VSETKGCIEIEKEQGDVVKAIVQILLEKMRLEIERCDP
jgi:hypothetical protein